MKRARLVVGLVSVVLLVSLSVVVQGQKAAKAPPSTTTGPTELLGQFMPVTESGRPGMMRNDTMVGIDGQHRPYITEKVSGWANAAQLSTVDSQGQGGRLGFQVTYPPDNQVRYVELDFTRPVDPSYTYPTGRLSCRALNSDGTAYGPAFLGPTAPAFLGDGQPIAHTTFIKLVSEFEWFQDANGDWGIDRANYRMLNVANMPKTGEPRYARALIYFDVADLEDLWLGITNQGVNGAAQGLAYIKVVRHDQTWTVTPIPAGEAGLSAGNIAHLSVPATPPRSPLYPRRIGSCDLGTFEMPFELRLTCDTNRSVCK